VLDTFREMEQSGLRVREMEDHIRVEYPNGGVSEYYDDVERYHGPKCFQVCFQVKEMPDGKRWVGWWPWIRR
jgi:hypothetical protein